MPELITPERARELLNGKVHWIDMDATLNAALNTILEMAATIDSLNYQIRTRDRRRRVTRGRLAANDPTADYSEQGNTDD